MYKRQASAWEPAKQALFDHSLEHVVLLEERDLQRCCNIFNDMYTCFTDSSTPDRQDMLYLKLVEFMMIFFRLQKKEASAAAASASVPASDNAIYDALRYIHQYFYTNLSPQTVAKEIGISVSSLKDLLIAYTGQDFGKLLTDIRLRNACVLLGLKTPTIRYIAQNTGFGSIQTFYRIFKEEKGMTPEEFRKKHWKMCIRCV